MNLHARMERPNPLKKFNEQSVPNTLPSPDECLTCLDGSSSM